MELKLNELNKVGRPKLPEGTHKTYQRIAVYPSTYRMIKKKTKKNKTLIMDYIDSLVKKDSN